MFVLRSHALNLRAFSALRDESFDPCKRCGLSFFFVRRQCCALLDAVFVVLWAAILSGFWRSGRMANHSYCDTSPWTGERTVPWRFLLPRGCGARIACAHTCVRHGTHRRCGSVGCCARLRIARYGLVSQCTNGGRLDTHRVFRGDALDHRYNARVQVLLVALAVLQRVR